MLLRALLDMIYPPICLGCGADAATGRLCDECDGRIKAMERLPACHRCGRTAQLFAVREEGCAYCIGETTWNFAGLARVGIYEPPLRDIVLQLKYAGRMAQGEWLAQRLAEAIRRAAWFDELDALVPVPMHWLRRLQRPCDHALALTRETARRLRLPVVRAVRRVKYAPSQTALSSLAARFQNVVGSFEPRQRWGGKSAIAGRTVCVVDNFLSSGATLRETVKAVRKCGAKRIYAAVVARGGDQPEAGLFLEGLAGPVREVDKIGVE
ncbi:MAG: ComF family protein [Phycisphaerae bacterium]|nr:ComF family protein [Phycisphaerae bacterium]